MLDISPLKEMFTSSSYFKVKVYGTFKSSIINSSYFAHLYSLLIKSNPSKHF